MVASGQQESPDLRVSSVSPHRSIFFVSFGGDSKMNRLSVCLLVSALLDGVVRTVGAKESGS